MPPLSPPQKRSPLSTYSNTWGDKDKVEVRIRGGIGVHNLSHTPKNLSCLHKLFYGHIIWFTPPPCKKNKRKYINFSRVHPNNRVREREREKYLIDLWSTTLGTPISTWNFPKLLVIVLDDLVCNGSSTSTIKKNALSTYIHTYGHNTQIKVVSSSWW